MQTKASDRMLGLDSSLGFRRVGSQPGRVHFVHGGRWHTWARLFGVRQRGLLFLSKWNKLPGPDDLRCVRVGPVHAIAVVLHLQLGQMEWGCIGSPRRGRAVVLGENRELDVQVVCDRRVGHHAPEKARDAWRVAAKFVRKVRCRGMHQLGHTDRVAVRRAKPCVRLHDPAQSIFGRKVHGDPSVPSLFHSVPDRVARATGVRPRSRRASRDSRVMRLAQRLGWTRAPDLLGSILDFL